MKEMTKRLEQAAQSSHTAPLGEKTQFIAKLTHELPHALERDARHVRFTFKDFIER